MTLTRRPSGSESTKPARHSEAKSLSELARKPDVALALDNNAFLRLAENIIYLRRYRGLTQQALAKKVKTSQAAVARMEGARENITLRTLEKVVSALDGRLQFAIAPAEVHLPMLPNWWDLISSHRIDARVPYTCTVIAKQEGSPLRVGAGWVAGADETAVIGPVTIAVPPARKALVAVAANPLPKAV
jgi:transcriptional regulator